jgi:hypothetical protein
LASPASSTKWPPVASRATYTEPADPEAYR